MIEPSGRMLFRILGPLEAWTGSGWAEVGAPKWRSLLAVLLLSPGRAVATDRLITEMWGDSPPARASNLVSVYVHRLRNLIGDHDGSVLVTRAPGYQVVLGEGQLDAQLFTAGVVEGREALAAGDPQRAADLLAGALGLWRGQALADVTGSPLVTAEAGRLEETRVEATALRIEADLGCGRYAQVVPELRGLADDHPLREGIWGLLMRALHGAGRQAEALAAYGRAREVIADELGVDPGAELQQIYQQILNADAANAVASQSEAAGALMPGPPLPAPAQLPADIPDFTGRADQVERLSALLTGDRGQRSPGAVPVVLVVGSGGLGKTTLAVHTAHLLAGQFPDGQLYASLLGATQPADPAEVLARFLRDLGVDAARIPVGEEERAAQLRTRLAGKQMLIVLDDAQNAVQVRPLLPGSATCAVLITARHSMPELAGSKVMDLEVLPPAEARVLFAQVAGEKRVGDEPGATGEVLAACAGLPLAIRIAGARLAARGGWNVHALADRLSDERRRLDELRAGNLAVRACFEVSFASLAGAGGPDGVDPAHAFRMLGLWTGPSISLLAASALLGAPEQAVEAALEVLLDAHLLDSPEPDRYRFHDLLRVYAADRVREQETEQDRRAAITRLLTWYLHTTESAARIISPHHARVPLGEAPLTVHPLSLTSLEEALTWCESERPGLAAAIRLAGEAGLHEIGWKLPAAAMSFYYRRSHWVDWVTTHQIGLASARILGDRQAEAWMLNNLGMAYGQQRMEESITCFEQALTISQQTGDKLDETRAANNAALAYQDLRRFGEALTAAQRSLVIQREAANRYGEGMALDILGSTCRELGRLAEAVGHLREALGIFREVGSLSAEAETLRDLGETYLLLSRIPDAASCLQDSLAIRRDIGDRRGEAATLRRLSATRLRAGDHREASELLTAALRLYEALRDERRSAEVRAELVGLGQEAC